MNLRHSENVVLFDFETESANIATARPWQFAYSIGSAENIKKTENIHIFWDDLNVSKGAQQITGFDYEHWRSKAIPAKDALEIIRNLFHNTDYWICGHNIIGFDIHIYNVMMRNLGYKADHSFNNRIVDSFCLAKAIYLNQDINTDNFFHQQIGLSRLILKQAKLSLGALAKKYDINVGEKGGRYHDAFYDIKINRLVLNQQAWSLKI